MIVRQVRSTEVRMTKYTVADNEDLEDVARQFEPGDFVRCASYRLQNRLLDALYFERGLSGMDTLNVLGPVSSPGAEERRQWNINVLENGGNP